ncbi:hypothetical protein B0J11DRAFT_616399 [Dendryphion nanum]|uniref:Uncharacterized protein n=1 Tax=Dendryphion nanum TaxID=256645 RepID=A0A9P9IIQ8_9PLEO|nr:hypothetical protein B0J11DRAFT_616399 [Dendryphion nanum]
MHLHNVLIAVVFLGVPSQAISRLRPWKLSDPCPTSLTTTIVDGIEGYYHYMDPDSEDSEEPEDSKEEISFEPASLETIHLALTSCPNITSLDLSIERPGCTGNLIRKLPFNESGGETYPALKSLRLDGYRFDQPSTRHGWDMRWKHRGVIDYVVDTMKWASGNEWHYREKYFMEPKPEGNKTNIDLWLEAMDWSQIEDLDIPVTEEVVAKIAPRLKSLKRLNTTSVPFVQALERNSLERLTWVEPRFSRSTPFGNGTLEAVLKAQGASLQELEMRCNEIDCGDVAGFENKELAMISSLAPKLTYFSTNLHRNGSWPLETLETVSSIASLRSVDLHLVLQSDCRREIEPTWQNNRGCCAGDNMFMEPFLNESSALDLFQFMKRGKVGQGWESVSFYIGDWGVAVDSAFDEPAWLEGRKGVVRCSDVGKREGEAWCRGFGYGIGRRYGL